MKSAWGTNWIPSPTHLVASAQHRGTSLGSREMEAAPGFEPGVLDLQSSALATWPCRLRRSQRVRRTGAGSSTGGSFQREPSPGRIRGHRGSGGIGRRIGLKSRSPQGRPGSSPGSPTSSQRISCARTSARSSPRARPSKSGSGGRSGCPASARASAPCNRRLWRWQRSA